MMQRKEAHRRVVVVVAHLAQKAQAGRAHDASGLELPS
jgi:hypothetical protein